MITLPATASGTELVWIFEAKKHNDNPEGCLKSGPGEGFVLLWEAACLQGFHGNWPATRRQVPNAVLALIAKTLQQEARDR